MWNSNITPENELIRRFNRRDTGALEEVYNLYYRELVYYARQLYRNTDVEGEDAVHDALVRIWATPKQQFEGVLNLKAYIYISLRNAYRNWLAHTSHKRRFERTAAERQHDSFTGIIEGETFSQIVSSLDLLPEDTARIFRMLMEGLTVKEIASAMEISQSSVYGKKAEGVSRLKKLLKDSDFILLLLSHL